MGIAMAAVLGVAAIATVASIISKNSSGDKQAKEIQNLNKEIYDLTKRAESMQTVISKFDALDEKVIKTNEDLKEMNNLLTSAADNLDDTKVKDKDDIGYGKGVNQKQAYEALTSDIEKRNFLETETKKTRQKIASKYDESRRQIEKLRSKGKLNSFLTGSSEEARAVRDSIYGYNNLKMYNTLDELTNSGAITSAESSNIET